MSYELHMLRTPLAEGPSAAFEGRMEGQAKELNPGPLAPALEVRKHQLAKALLDFSPALAMARFDYLALAAKEGVDEAEVRRRYRHVELNSDDQSGIQITLWDEAADLTFPYWHSGEQSERVLRDVWELAELLERWGSFITFDPQLDRALNLGIDYEAVLANYQQGPKTAYEQTEHPLEPWRRWRVS